MSLMQRIKSIAAALLMIAAAVAMLIYPGTGLAFIALILSASLTLYGLRTLVYYFSMARHMVGGKRILYQGLIVFDLGIFTLTMAYNHTIYVILYLLAIHAFAGVVDVMRAMEARRFDGPWRMDMLRYCECLHRHTGGDLRLLPQQHAGYRLYLRLRPDLFRCFENRQRPSQDLHYLYPVSGLISLCHKRSIDSEEELWNCYLRDSQS